MRCIGRPFGKAEPSSAKFMRPPAPNDLQASSFSAKGGTIRIYSRFHRTIRRRWIMLYWALVFLVVAIIAGALGFGGIAGTSAGIAQILFFIFLAFLVISLLAGLFKRAS
jgi:uncharacterized membrane protein YtjA (UPF0391 family)